MIPRMTPPTTRSDNAPNNAPIPATQIPSTATDFPAGPVIRLTILVKNVVMSPCPPPVCAWAGSLTTVNAVAAKANIPRRRASNRPAHFPTHSEPSAATPVRKPLFMRFIPFATASLHKRLELSVTCLFPTSLSSTQRTTASRPLQPAAPPLAQKQSKTSLPSADPTTPRQLPDVDRQTPSHPADAESAPDQTRPMMGDSLKERSETMWNDPQLALGLPVAQNRRSTYEQQPIFVSNTDRSTHHYQSELPAQLAAPPLSHAAHIHSQHPAPDCPCCSATTPCPTYPVDPRRPPAYKYLPISAPLPQYFCRRRTHLRLSSEMAPDACCLSASGPGRAHDAPPSPVWSRAL